MFRILVVEVVLTGVTLILAQAFMSLGRPGIITILQSIGLVLSITLMSVLVPDYGLVGAGLALLCSTIVRLVLMLLSFPLFLKVHPPNILLTGEDVVYLRQKFLRG